MNRTTNNLEFIFFDYWNKLDNLNEDYLKKYFKEEITGMNNNIAYYFAFGNEACPEFLRKEKERILNNLRSSLINSKKVRLILPPMYEKNFYLLKEIKDFLKKLEKDLDKNTNYLIEISFNDLGSLNYFKDNYAENNEKSSNIKPVFGLGRQIIKFKTGKIKKELEDYIKSLKEEWNEIRKPLISQKLISYLKKEFDIKYIELNPIEQGFDVDKLETLKKNFRLELHWPYLLHASTFMCWSNIDNVISRTNDCDTLCKTLKGKFIENDYILQGNQTLSEQNISLMEYLDKYGIKKYFDKIILHKRLI